jgi:hypothetical protein
MTTWLEQELVSRYGMGPRTASAWSSQKNRLVLLLDGLDEVPEPHRQECVRAINAYRAEHDPAPATPSGPAPALVSAVSEALHAPPEHLFF